MSSPSSPSTLLDVIEVEARYGQVRVLNGLTMQVRHGESVALIGPNGHGKSTLLRLVSGLKRASSGQVFFEGTNLHGMSPRRIVEFGVVHCPQASRLFPDMTVEENLNLGGYLVGGQKARGDLLRGAYDLFPRLEERRNQYAGTLSGGERQMTAIGMALMSRPRLLMLDEPTLGLAPRARGELRDAVLKIRRTGVSLLVVDGDIDFLGALTDRWYLVQLGEVVMKGEGAESLANRELIDKFFGG